MLSKGKTVTEQKNDQGNCNKQRIFRIEEKQEKCPSCDSKNVEIYHKDGFGFIQCNDCGRKALLD